MTAARFLRWTIVAVGTLGMVMPGFAQDSVIATGRPDSELSVPAVPPTANPKWFEDDSSWAGADHDGFLKRVVSIIFEPQATRREKQAAVDAIHGRAIGGLLVGTSWGAYYVQVADDGNGTQLGQALDVLKTLPQVRAAGLINRGDLSGVAIRIRGLSCAGGKTDSVPAVPPSGRPAWLYDDSMQIPKSGRVSKDVIKVAFVSGVSQELKQKAIDSVCGKVVGGMPGPDEYFVKVPTDGTASTLHSAVDKIKSMPGVLAASIYVTGGLVP